MKPKEIIKKNIKHIGYGDFSVNELQLDLDISNYGIQERNIAVRAIQKEYETNKDFNITSILKYLK